MSMKYQILSFLTIVNFFVMISETWANEQQDSQGLSETEQKSLAILRHALATQNEWVKVHAAEYLIWSGHSQGVKEVCLKEEKLHAARPPYRIGIWRVLAQAAGDATEKKVWTDKIMAVFLDSTATDRTHAAETLAKLKISPLHDDKHLTEKTLLSPIKPLALYTLWSISFTSPDSLKAAPGKFLDLIDKAGDEASRKTIPAYALRQIKGLSAKQWEKLAAAALAEPRESHARIYLLSAAFTTIKDDRKQEKRSQIHTEILKYKNAASKGDISEMCAALAEEGTKGDLPLLSSLTQNLSQFTNEADIADVNAAAAYAILKIIGRNK